MEQNQPQRSNGLATSNKLLVNHKRQNGNPILKYIRNVPYEWSESIGPDFVCSNKCCVLYLSLKYHKAHPGYIETRFECGNPFSLKILLVLINVDDPTHVLRDLNMFCYRMNWALILVYSVEEGAEYLENFKLLENRTPETIINSQQQKFPKEKQQALLTDLEKNQQLYNSAINLLCSIRKISKTDAKFLIGSFGSLMSISKATCEELELCPGLGPIKANSIYTFFRAPFIL